MTVALNIPRSILKKSKPLSVSVSPTNHPPDHAVHFPPSPCISSTFEVHSSSMYDRSPIVVGPNTCALPARGCPGRTYYKLDDDDEEEEEEDELRLCSRFLQAAESRESKRGHAHPRALEREVNLLVDDNDIPLLPLLIPDLTTSESEESDGFISPPPESSFSRLKPSNDTALFAAEPPAFHLLPSFSIEQAPTYVVEPKPRPIPSKPRGRRFRSSSLSPPLHNDELDEDSGYIEDTELAATPTRRSSLSPPRLSSSPPKKSCKKLSTLRSQLCKALSFQSERSTEDDGCLGGF